MAGFLNALGVLLLACASTAAWADSFYDPTRPPPAFLPPAMQQSAASAPVEKPLELQSILLAPQRKIAVINGQSLKPGQSIRGYQLLSLGSSEARLLGPDGIITLKLLSARSHAAESVSAAEPGKNSRGESK